MCSRYWKSILGLFQHLGTLDLAWHLHIIKQCLCLYLRPHPSLLRTVEAVADADVPVVYPGVPESWEAAEEAWSFWHWTCPCGSPAVPASWADA